MYERLKPGQAIQLRDGLRGRDPRHLHAVPSHVKFTRCFQGLHNFSLQMANYVVDLMEIERETPMTSRVDMHCHSTASQLSRLGVQRSLGLPECATPPAEVYELAKRRGMDFVTITDHDTIGGCLELDGRPDCFVSEELTARFAGEPQAVHVLCYGITSGDHEWLQAHSGDVEACAAYLHEYGIASALAHPFFNVAAPLTRRHRRRLAELFPIWEVRNGSRAAELNMPAVVYIETRGGTGIGGSDDHAGVDIGRTFTEAPAAATPEEFLRHLLHGAAEAGGEQGSAAKWTHSAMALATRALGEEGAAPVEGGPNPAAVLKMAERVIREGAVREGKVAADIGPDDARCLLESWLAGMGLDLRGRDLIAYLQADDFSHADLYRRARRIHDRRLRGAIEEGTVAVADGDYSSAVNGLFAALLPAIPYAPSTAFLGAEKAMLSGRRGERGRVALIADGIGSMHGVTHTIEQIRERGVPGFEIDVIGTDAGVDRRLPAAAEIDMPFYEGMRLGVPGLPDLVEALADGVYDLVHVTAPGPAGIAATLLSRVTGVPLLASYHTELAAYAGMRSGDDGLEAIARMGLGAFYGASRFVLSPSPSADASLAGLGTDPARIGRWERGVDVSRFDPVKADRSAYPGEIKVLYAGRLTREKGVDLLAESFLRAHRADPRLHLLLAGGGPEEEELRARLGEHATFLGWLGGEDLACAYASADVFLFASSTDTYGQVILEAAASGLPVVAVAEGGPAALIENRHTGLLCRPDADHLAGALLQLASAPLLRHHLGAAGAHAARARTWERSMGQLATGYRRALDAAPAAARQPVAQAA
jgi:glycosyltransferase involved in cell wall biosynthesis/predicted metal-dependent phosphoesterase TrpH